jgi:hypothetical protein
MSKFSDALRAGFQAARQDYAERRDRPAGSRFAAAGALVRCAHCGGERFEARETLLHANVMPVLDSPWLDRSATLLICVQCAELRWFGLAPSAEE